MQSPEALKAAYEDAQNAEGSALAENEKYLSSIQGRIDLFTNSVQTMWSNFIDSDVVKFVVDLGTKLIKLIDTIGVLPSILAGVFVYLTAFKKQTPLALLQQIWSVITNIGTSVKANGFGRWLTSLLGITPALKAVNAEMVANTIATQTNDAAKTKQMMTEMGLSGVTGTLTAKQREAAMTATLQAMSTGQLTMAQGNAILAMMGYSAATVAADGSLKTLDATTKSFMATNPIGWILAIVSVVMTLVTVLGSLINTTKKTAEAANEAMSEYKNLTQTLKDHYKTIQDIRKDYVELADGVDALGNNVSLTSEEYERYNEIANQIADMFPDMVTGYTEEGNAIINLKGNVEALTKAYEKEAQAARDAILIGQNDVFKNFKNNTTKKSFWTGASKVDELKFFEDLVNGKSFVNDDSFKKWRDGNKLLVDNWLENAGIDSTNWFSSNKSFDKAIQENLSQIQAYYRTLKATIDAEASSVRTVLNAYLEQDFDYIKLSDDAKSAIKSMVNQLDTEFYYQFDSASEMEAWITTNLVQPLQDADTSAEFSAAFDLQTKFNEGKVSVEEYENMVAGIISLINDLGLENADSIIKSIKLIFDVDDSGRVDSSIQEAAKKILNPSDYDKIKTLTKSELDIINQNVSEWTENAVWDEVAETWKIGDPILMSWDELKKKIEEAKSAIDDTKSSDSIKSLVSIKDKLSELGGAFDEFKENGKVSIDTISELNEKFGNIDGFEDFINVLGSSASTTEQVEQAISDMASAYLATTDILSNVTDANYDFVVSQLKALGVTNPEEYLSNLQSVHQAMADEYGVDLSNYGTVEQMKQAISSDLYSILVGLEGMTIQELASKYGDDLLNYGNLEEAKTEAARREALKRQEILKGENATSGAQNAAGWRDSQTVGKDEIDTGWWIFGKNKYEGKSFSEMEALANSGDSKAKAWVDQVQSTYDNMVQESTSSAESAYKDAVDGINNATKQFNSIDDYVAQYNLKLKVNVPGLGGDKDPETKAKEDAEDVFKKEMDYWENRISAQQAKRDQVQNEIDLLESQGIRAGEEYYKELIALETERKAMLEAQKEEAIKYLKVQEEGSEEWF